MCEKNDFCEGCLQIIWRTTSDLQKHILMLLYDHIIKTASPRLASIVSVGEILESDQNLLPGIKQNDFLEKAALTVLESKSYSKHDVYRELLAMEKMLLIERRGNISGNCRYITISRNGYKMWRLMNDEEGIA